MRLEVYTNVRVKNCQLEASLQVFCLQFTFHLKVTQREKPYSIYNTVYDSQRKI